MSEKYIYTFSVSPYYRSCTVYSAKATTREIMCHSRISFDKGVTIKNRYAEIVRFLRDYYKIKCPPFEAGRKR